MTRTLAIALVYALALLGAGVWAWRSAPPGANAATAIAVTGGCAAVALLLGAFAHLALREGRLSRARAFHLALLLVTILFAALFASRAASANKSTNLHDQALFRYEAGVRDGSRQDTPEARAAFLKQEGVAPHSKQYLANTLWTLCFFSAGVFVALLVTRPRERPSRS